MKEKLVLGATSLLKKCWNCKNGKNQHDLVLVLTVLSLPSCNGANWVLKRANLGCSLAQSGLFGAQMGPLRAQIHQFQVKGANLEVKGAKSGLRLANWRHRHVYFRLSLAKSGFKGTT